MHVLPPASHHIRAAIKRALKEDLPFGDVTTQALFPSPIPAQATIIAHESLTLAGLAVANQVFREMDPTLHLQGSCSDGEVVRAISVLLTVKGDARSILKSERVALNLLQHLSGIATLTAQFCQEIKDFPTKILDTQKNHSRSQSFTEMGCMFRRRDQSSTIVERWNLDQRQSLSCPSITKDWIRQGL